MRERIEAFANLQLQVILAFSSLEKWLSLSGILHPALYISHVLFVVATVLRRDTM
jgi:hypothetical protein